MAIGVYCFGLTAGLMAFGAAPRDACYRLFLVMALACALAAWFCPTRDLLQKRFLPLLLVGAVILAQIPLRPPVERYGYVFLALGWMALTFTLLVARQPRFAQFLFLFLMALGLLDAFFGLMQALGGMDFATTDYDRPAAAMATGTFANRNHFAGLLNMTIPIALGGLWATFPRRGGKLRSEGYAWAWIILLVTSFMGLAILLSWSRGGTLSLAAGLIFLAFLILMRRRAREEGATRLSAGAIFVLLLATTVLGAWVGIDQLLDRFGRTEDDAISRVLVYRDSIRLIADYPLGVGPKMYQYYFRPPVDISQDCRWTHAHNDYLETAVEWGIPVALLFWGFIAWRLWKAGSVFLGGKRDEENSPGTASSLWREGMALGCAGAVFSILLHSLVDFNLQIPVNWVVFCMILGLAWRLHGAEVSSVGRGSLVFAVIFTLTLAWSAFPVFKEAVAIQIADSETIPAFEEALTWVPDQPAFHFAVGLLYRDDVDHQDL
ncbi:MAG TPA: O-antigen ligase family protein, partial [Acidobacteriota bacterium]|nr:O-antigen ligase family protein [Acidobacteriota bacterium]